MFSKSLVFFFFGLLACQGLANAYSVSIDERSLADDIAQIIQEIKDSIQNGVANIKDFIEQYVGEVTEKFNEFVKQLREFIQGKVQEFQEKFEKFVEDLRGELQELKDKAEQVHADIKECVESEKEKIKDLRQKMIEGYLGCTKDKVEALRGLVQEIRNTVKDYKSRAMDLVAKFKNCNKSPVCMAGVVGEFGQLIKEVPGVIRKFGEEARTLFQQIKNEVPACLKDVFGPLKEEAVAIKQEIKECINNKIHGQ